MASVLAAERLRAAGAVQGPARRPARPFGYTPERREERGLVEDYFALARELSAELDADNHALAVTLAACRKRSAASAMSRRTASATAKEEWAKGLAAWRREAPLAQAAE